MQQNSGTVTIKGAQQLLRDIGMDDERSNQRSAMVFLALCALDLNSTWSEATNNMYRTRAIMDWIAQAFNVEYKPNTRETVRRFTLHQFVLSGAVEENADDPSRPTNSPKWNYRLTDAMLCLVRSYSTPDYDSILESFKKNVITWNALIAEKREITKIPVSLPDGAEIHLSAGGQNVLIKEMIEQFCPRFAPGARVLYVGDTSKVNETLDKETLNKIGVTLPPRGKEPDLIVWREDKNWLYLMEACSTHGPVDVTRKNELLELFGGYGHDLIFISCFPNRKIMQGYLSDLAWETEAWCADTPDHMIHLNGEKFMGPY